MSEQEQPDLEMCMIFKYDKATGDFAIHVDPGIPRPALVNIMQVMTMQLVAAQVAAMQQQQAARKANGGRKTPILGPDGRPVFS